MQKNPTTRFQSTKTYDVLIAAPLIAFYGFSLAGLRPQFDAALRLRPAWLSALQLTALASFAFYLALVIVLVFLRRMPLAKSEGVWPRALALGASTILFALPWLQAAPMSSAMIAVSAVLTGGGTIAELFILAWLGRAFSILPEARRLVTRGPYRYVRHPLYLSGMIIAFGAMLHFEQPWSLLLVLFGLVFQIWRLHYEEQVLGRAFPEYADYAARSWRLVPGIY